MNNGGKDYKNTLQHISQILDISIFELLGYNARKIVSNDHQKMAKERTINISLSKEELHSVLKEFKHSFSA